MRPQWLSSSLLASICAICAVLATAQDTPVFTKASNDSLLWAPYRPNLYFGLRPRIPHSILTSLLWARVEEFQPLQDHIRDTCEQHSGLDGYGWEAYDPRTGGVQVIHDKGSGIDIETSFVKFDHGKGGWGARIKGTPREDAEPGEGSTGPDTIKTAVWFALSAEGLSAVLVQDSDAGEELGFPGDVVLEGRATGLGEFKLTITEPAGTPHPLHSHDSYQSKPLDHTFVDSQQLPEEQLWQSKVLLLYSLQETITGYVKQYTKERMPPPWQTYTIKNQPGQGNFHLVQKVFEGPFEFDILFTPASAEKPATTDDLTKTIEVVLSSFEEKFLKIHGPQPPFTDQKWLEFSKSLFSNLIGGIGYFYGEQIVDRSYAPEYDEENEGFWQEAEEARARKQPRMEVHELFTAIPSRPFFPRGFLWDEGFHLLPILDWDPELSMRIVSSWFNTMDEDGWIAREQILGAEARSKVPEEFRIQYPHHANPPTLFMAIEALLDKTEHKAGFGAPLEHSTLDHLAGHVAVSPETVKAWLMGLYPQLQRNFDWYRRTQWGDLKSYDRKAFSTKEGYRWRGRTLRHILTSGLDDYPRPQPPHPGELHVDLMSWMGMMSRNMYRIAGFLGENDDQAKYGKIVEAIRRNMDDLHWSAEHKAYCDATIDDYEESIHVCRKGYISIFPFMTGLLDSEHEHLGDVLDLIADEEELWSPHGIRSLSKKDELYGTDENYWRSPVWINMNYLILKQLYIMSQQPGPLQKRTATMYGALRKNLVETVYRSWLDTGFAWEQYNPETGAGQRTQHFTGWTSLIVNIMAMPDLDGKKDSGHDEL